MLKIDLGNSIHYSFASKNNQQTKILSQVSSFSNLNRISGNPIYSHSEVDGMIGENFFKWLGTWSEKPSQATVKEEYTKRVVALIKDLTTALKLDPKRITLTGPHVQYLNLDHLLTENLHCNIHLNDQVEIKTKSPLLERPGQWCIKKIAKLAQPLEAKGLLKVVEVISRAVVAIFCCVICPPFLALMKLNQVITSTTAINQNRPTAPSLLPWQRTADQTRLGTATTSSTIPKINQNEIAIKQLEGMTPSEMDSNWCLHDYFGSIKVITSNPNGPRYQKFKEEAAKIGLSEDHYEISLGVNGSTLDKSIWNRMVKWDEKRKTKEDLQKQLHGQTGCFMAHYQLIKTTVESYRSAVKRLENLQSSKEASQEEREAVEAEVRKHSSLLIFEDNNGFGALINKKATLEGMGYKWRLAMSVLPRNWDMFYFMSMCDAQAINAHLAKLDYGLTTKCFAINAQMYDRILEALQIIENSSKELKPVDHEIASLHGKSNAFVVYPPLSYRVASISEVSNGGGDDAPWVGEVKVRK